MNRSVMLVTLGGLVACYNPAATIDANLDAIVNGDGLDDADLDGVNNANDNCVQVANPNQHDSDGDRIGDVCDPCPVDVNTEDTDADGVAGICDHESDKANRIVWFQPFDGSALPAGWSIRGAATTGFGGGGLSILATSPTYLLAPGVTASPGRLLAGFSTLVTPSSTATARVGAMTGFDSATEAHIECNVFRIDTVSSIGLVRFTPLASTMVLGSTPFSDALGVGDYVIGLSGNETGGTCQAAKLMTNETATGAAPMVLQGTTGLRVENTSVRVQWLMLVQRKP